MLSYVKILTVELLSLNGTTNMPSTYKEGQQYYGIITLPNGFDYYYGPYSTRGKAYYVAKKQQLIVQNIKTK